MGLLGQEFDIIELTEDAPIDWPVVFDGQVSGGKTVKYEFTAKFVRLDQDQITQYQDDDKAFMAKILVGWGEDLKLSGKPLKFTDENRDLLASQPWIKRGIFKSYFGFIQGYAVKN